MGHRPIAICSCPIVLLALAGSIGHQLRAQVPAHAVQVNPVRGIVNPEFVRSGSQLHVVTTVSTGSSRWETIYARSDDGGRTMARSDVVIDAGLPIENFAVDGMSVHVGSDGGAYRPHVVSSFDGGDTWRAATPIGPRGFGTTAPVPVIQADQGIVNCVWLVEAQTGPEVRATRSTDGGVTWSGVTQRIDNGVPSAPAFRQADDGLQVFAAGNVLHVIWRREIEPVGNGSSTFHAIHQRSLDGGATWEPSAQVIAASTLGAAPNEDVLPAAIANGVMLVVLDGMLWRSADQGATWSPTNGHQLARVTGLAADGSIVMVSATVPPWPGSLQLNASADAGQTWRSQPFVIDLTSPATATPHVAGDALFVDVRYAFYPSRVIQSDDLANNWRLLADVGEIVAADADGAILQSYAPPGTVWLSALEAHTALGQGSPGTGGLVPQLDGRGVAGLGRTIELAVSNAAPNALTGYFASFLPTVAVPLGPSTLYLDQPIGLGFVVNSAAGKARLPITLPASAAFAGLRIASQALVVDSGVAAGFAMTRAIETWVD
ncbi:MAG: glycoside hydrolase [bacterium]|nr:glycoside hydrolase [bacterium]